LIGEKTEEKLAHLKEKLNNFYMKYLVTLNLQNADLIDAIECIQMKPVTHLIFFRTVNFLNMVTAIKNLRIKKCIFLYKKEIVYSSVNPIDLYAINEYLNDSLFPKHLQRRNTQNFEADVAGGCYITEVDDALFEEAPRVYLQQSRFRAELRAYRMVVFTISDVTLLMLIEGETHIWFD